MSRRAARPAILRYSLGLGLLLVFSAMSGCSALAKPAAATTTPSASASAAASARADAAPVFDVPRVENLKIDGDLADWGAAGLRVESLVEADKLAPKPSEFDAQLYLAYLRTNGMPRTANK